MRGYHIVRLRKRNLIVRTDTYIPACSAEPHAKMMVESVIDENDPFYERLKQGLMITSNNPKTTQTELQVILLVKRYF